MDWASRYVLSWEISVAMNDDFCVNALKSLERPHQSFSGKTPAEMYWGEEVARMAA